MSAAVSYAVPAPPLPNLFSAPVHHARFSSLPPAKAVKLASEVLVRTLNTIAIDPATRVSDRRVTEDRRFSLTLTVAVPLSLQGQPARPEHFSEVERRVLRVAGERGVTGPAGRALEAARLITCAVGAAEQAGALASRAVDAAIEAEVLAASLQGRNLREARATAERRVLDICNPQRRASARSWSPNPEPGDCPMTDVTPITPSSEWLAAEALHAARTRLSADALAANKVALFEALTGAGVTTVVVGFDGMGDSGQIESVDAFKEELGVPVPDTQVQLSTVAWDGGGIELRPASLADALEALAYDLLEGGHSGWEDNSGAFGEFTFDVAQRAIRLDFNQRIETSELTVFEW